MNGETDSPTKVRRNPKVGTFRVLVEQIEESATDKDSFPVLDVRVEVLTEATLTSGYGASARTDDQPSPIALQLQIRAALEAARPGGS